MDIALILVAGALTAITTFLGARSGDKAPFTKVGWLAVFLSFLVLGGNIYQVYAKRQESERLLTAIARESFRLSPQDFQLWVLIKAPGYDPSTDVALTRHRLDAKLSGKHISIVVEPALAPERRRAGRGGGGAALYRFVSVSFYFFELGGELFLEDLRGKTMEIVCDPKALGFLVDRASCTLDLFVKGRHFSGTDLDATTIRISFGAL